MDTKRVLLNEFRDNKDSYFIIDIRGAQSYKAAHLPNSINLCDINEILDTLKNIDSQSEILFVCFSSIRAKKMAMNIAAELQNIESLKDKFNINYLDSGIMEVYNAGIFQDFQDFVESNLANLDSIQSNLQNLDALGYGLSMTNKTPHSLSMTDNFTESKSPLAIKTLNDIKSKYLSSKRAFVVAFSGGKDSTCVLQLVYEMLVSLPSNLRRPTFAIASNTLVEAPHINRFLKSIIESINRHARENNIPFKVIEVAPETKDEFWVNLIGKGYPSPTRTFRWCTERLKINPSKATIANIAKEFGSVILCLGTRKSESANRKRSMEMRLLSEYGYVQHHDFPNTLTYSPIAEWGIDDVWGYLLSNKPLWDKDHSELFSLYSKASGDECQFITDLRQSSCGGSRFGCWICTVVSEDKSLKGFINSGDSNLKPLNNFRNYIKELREDSNARADYKRDGRAVYKVGGLGAFLSAKRIEILQNLLETEREYMSNGGTSLISDSQILAIQKEWNKDFDFNDTALTLAREYGRMENIELKAKSKILNTEILKEIIDNDKENLGLDSNAIENLISSSIDIFNDNGSINAGRKIKQEIEKLLHDKTSKVLS